MGLTLGTLTVVGLGLFLALSASTAPRVSLDDYARLEEAVRRDACAHAGHNKQSGPSGLLNASAARERP